MTENNPEFNLKHGTKEWSSWNFNFCYGCKNNCRYCYAMNDAKRHERIQSLVEEAIYKVEYPEKWGRIKNAIIPEWKNMKLNSAQLEKNFKKRKGRGMTPTSHDLFIEHIIPIIKIYKKLLMAGNELLITTKPSLEVIKSLCFDFKKYRNQIQFRFTITSLSDTKLWFWEENAPNYEERLQALEYASFSGFKTSVSIEPFLDKNPVPLIKEVAPLVSETIWLGIMSQIKRKFDLREEMKYQWFLDMKNAFTPTEIERLTSKPIYDFPAYQKKFPTQEHRILNEVLLLVKHEYYMIRKFYDWENIGNVLKEITKLPESILLKVRLKNSLIKFCKKNDMENYLQEFEYLNV
jgi:DNA repair photolyase